MSFRDQAIADLSTFLSADEFGDTIAIAISGGAPVPMACVLVNDEAPDGEDGVSALESTLYVRASDFTQEPAVRQRMTVGGKQATVIRVDEEQGMYVIRLRWFNS